MFGNPITSIAAGVIGVLGLYAYLTHNALESAREAIAVHETNVQVLKDELKDQSNELSESKLAHALIVAKLSYSLEQTKIIEQQNDEKQQKLTDYKGRLSNAAKKKTSLLERRVNRASTDVLREFETLTDRSDTNVSAAGNTDSTKTDQ